MKRLVELFCNPYRRGNYMRFYGCAAREEFWTFLAMHMLLQMSIYLGLQIGAMVLDSDTLMSMFTGEPDFPIIVGAGLLLAYFVFMLATIIPGLALTVRRYHDAGLSGYWLLAIVLTGIGCTALVFSELFYATAHDIYPGALNSPFMRFFDNMTPWDFYAPVLAVQIAALLNLVILILPGGSLSEKYRARERERVLIQQRMLQEMAG